LAITLRMLVSSMSVKSAAVVVVVAGGVFTVVVVVVVVVAGLAGGCGRSTDCIAGWRFLALM